MKHVSEEQLVLHYYSDDVERLAVEEHLGACAECREQYEALQATLGAVVAGPVPERGDDYGAQVWRRVRARLPEPKEPWWKAWVRPQRLAWAGAMAALLLVAFYVGRISQPPPDSPTVAQGSSEPAAAGERILLVAVGEHLERSQMLLVELMNAPAGDKVDLSTEQQWAEDLLGQNRLYRQTAARTEDAAVRELLGQLEQVLVEVANSPSEVDAARLNDLQDQIRSRGLLFRVRVMGSNVRQKQKRVPETPDVGTT